MPVVMSRVDERLIHGQMALAWLKKYNVDCVIVIDDASAADQLQTMLLQMAVSGSIECLVTSEADAKDLIQSNMHKKLFLCAKLPGVFVRLLEQGVEIPHVNIGGIYNKPGRTQYFTTIFLDEPIKADILALERFPDTKVEYRVVPNDSEVDIIRELKKK